jgi:hypothetical protein
MGTREMTGRLCTRRVVSRNTSSFTHVLGECSRFLELLSACFAGNTLVYLLGMLLHVIRPRELFVAFRTPRFCVFAGSEGAVACIVPV